MATKRAGPKPGQKLSPVKNEALLDRGMPLTDEALEDEAGPAPPFDVVVKRGSKAKPKLEGKARLYSAEMNRLLGPGFKWKDLRLMNATRKAVAEMKKIKPPKTGREL